MTGHAPGAPSPLTAWFRDHTWSVDDVDVERLAAGKAADGLSVSVVVPARNEAETVAGVVAACAALGEALVDEIVVLDGDSTDDTARLAADAGARVHRDRAVLPEFGPPQGKGDALWRSLAVTSGDLVCFVDADISNPSPGFVAGLLAPLLADARIQLVKAFYARPLEVDGHRHAGAGGRVTELTARPLLNLLWPELAGLVQPLSGEYAARRTLLESVPMFTGYGVELGLLVDTVRRHGAQAIAQVDVHERVHRNQPLDALGRMAFAICQVALRRLAEEGRADGLGELPDTLVQFARDGATTTPEPHEVTVAERPPMRTVR